MDKIIDKLSVKFNMDSDLLERIVRSEFKFIADTMSEGNFESVHLQYFGKIAVKPNRLKTINLNASKTDSDI